MKILIMQYSPASFTSSSSEEEDTFPVYRRQYDVLQNTSMENMLVL
jgi:hypothetical protein